MEPFSRRLESAASRLLPTLDRGLTKIAGTLGNFGGRFLEFLADSRSLSVLEKVFTNTAVALQNSSDGAFSLFRQLRRITGIGADFLPRIGTAVGDLLQNISDRLAKVNVRKAIEDGIQAAKDLYSDFKLVLSIGKKLGSVFSSIFGDDINTTFLNVIDEAAKSLDKFFKTAGAQEDIRLLKTTINDLARIFTRDLKAQLPDILSSIRILLPQAVSLFDSISRFGASLSPSLPLLSQVLVGIAEFVGSGLDAITDKLIKPLTKFGGGSEVATLTALFVAIGAVKGLSALAGLGDKLFGGPLGQIFDRFGKRGESPAKPWYVFVVNPSGGSSDVVPGGGAGRGRRILDTLKT
ncbi:hypothetical protein, partial [Actinoplanes derwentensis]